MSNRRRRRLRRRRRRRRKRGRKGRGRWMGVRHLRRGDRDRTPPPQGPLRRGRFAGTREEQEYLANAPTLGRHITMYGDG